MFTVRVHCDCGCENKFPIQFKDGKYILTPQWEQAGQFGVPELPLIFASIEEWRKRGGKIKNLLLRKAN